MTSRDAQERWVRFWARVDAETKAQKVSQAAVFELSQYYRSLQDVEREAVDALLGGWVLDGNEGKRFDALALIDEHAISDAIPALEELRHRLDESKEPGAPFEKAKVDRIIAVLRKDLALPR